jgi:hypothetical protein
MRGQRQPTTRLAGQAAHPRPAHQAGQQQADPHLLLQALQLLLLRRHHCCSRCLLLLLLLVLQCPRYL